MPSYSKKVQIPGKTSQELYDTISTHIDRFLDKTPLGKYELERDSAQKEFRIKSSMFTATLKCVEAAMELNGSLSLFAAPFRGKLDEGIEKWIAKTFPS